MLRYAVPLFLAAFLLFQVQPIIARVILPWFGGAPSVWTTCMLFFQALLVGGYAYTHFLSARLRPKTQAVVHGCLLIGSLGLLGWMLQAWGAPLVPSASWRPAAGGYPVLQILGILIVAVGLPYFVLATTSPLMQAWFSRSAPGVSPYRLYSLSNFGSLLALVSYPIAFEPAFAQRQQAEIWSGVYVLFALGCLFCAAGVARLSPGPAEVSAKTTATTAEGEAPTWGQRALWVLLPGLASLMLLAVTNHLCQDVAVTPFLWVLPLSLYLLSFIICFDHERWYFRPVWLPLQLLVIPGALAALPYPRDIALVWQIAIFSLALFVCCMVCHGELVALKPKPRHLTSFYLAVAVGGALGGILVGVVAPAVFETYAELPVGLVVVYLVAVFAPWGGAEKHWRPVVFTMRVVLVAGAVFLALLPQFKNAQYGDIRVLARSRNFYGVLRVEEREAGGPEAVHMLLHGRIIHGFQYRAEELQRIPTSYYGPESGIALAVKHHPRRERGEGLRIAVAGLGVGTMAAFCEPQDYLCFYEINPVVVDLARDTSLFTYLSDCPGRVEVVLGDARLSLERELEQGSKEYDLILLDAFSGDAVPAHLLTQQAFGMYLQHLRPGGAICADVSNAVLDLPPVLWQLADRLNLDTTVITSSKGEHYYTANWTILTPERNYLRDAEIAHAKWSYDGARQVRPWTDDYYNLFQILK
ncbi:MAG: ferrichrome ABC transporter permease [Armatimonadetes bacterium]|nr:ferrichrome ABC transporter permease [Armatimonadota bacterium]